MHRLAIAVVGALLLGASLVACEDETFEKPADYDLSKPIRDLSATAQSHDDLSATPVDLGIKKDLTIIVLPDLRLNLPDQL